MLALRLAMYSDNRRNAEIGAEDLTRTAVLQARYLWGGPKLCDEFLRRVADPVQGKAVNSLKTSCRTRRATRAENSRMALEPNIKEGTGGFGDIHALEWIAHVVFGRNWQALVERGVLAQEQLESASDKRPAMTVRFYLHQLVKRAEERLTLTIRPRLPL